jgi:Rad3-related DNA helicase
MRERLQVLLGDGWRHTYLYPGLHKVAQAAGRVIRTPEDRGLVVLLDERFAQPEVRALLPAWWPAPA